MSSITRGNKYPDSKDRLKGSNNCWDCRFQQNDESTLFGVCTWFAHNGRNNKDIPHHIINIGCKFHVPKLRALLPTEVRGSV